MNRTGWLDLMFRVQPGDTIAVAFLDRFSRNFEEGVRIQAERQLGLPFCGIRPGTYAVGQDIDPGTYVGIAGTGVLDTCYWARLQGVSGALDDILANDNAMGQFYIEVLEGDGYLETHCQITSLAAWPEPSELPESLQPGTYLVGRDIAAGTYRGEAGEEVLDWCYWARLNGVTGELKDVAANHNATGGPFYVEMLDTDYALNTTCDLERVT